ncbi:MAG TPA: hypothetical protein VFJ07_00810 [Streptosporangiaceae bacterium]|nr:hypothetical protein [Streptosporangiaceae bacterium]
MDRLRRREANAAPWALSAAEWRLLVITFADGLASIAAAACIIAGAIALDRWIARNEHGHINWWSEAEASRALLLVGVLILFWRAGPLAAGELAAVEPDAAA